MPRKSKRRAIIGSGPYHGVDGLDSTGSASVRSGLCCAVSGQPTGVTTRKHSIARNAKWICARATMPTPIKKKGSTTRELHTQTRLMSGANFLL